MKDRLRKRELSEEQIELRDYLLRKLGFTEGIVKESYSKALTQYFYDKNYVKEFTFLDNRTGKEVTVDVHYTVVDALNDELKFREGKKWIYKNRSHTSKAISATELAAFSFCPASFCIANTFESKPTEEMEIGTEHHEESFLSHYRKKTFIYYQTESLKSDGSETALAFIDKDNKLFFDKIRNSTLLYSGHQDHKDRLFYNSKKTFVGQPDYVFQSKNGGNFIVEEKYKSNKDLFTFFINHKVQLASYIYGLIDFRADYGYLVYWFYDNGGNGFQITHCKVLKVVKTEAAKSYLNEIFKSIELLISGKKLSFDISSISANKCIRCSLNKWCGHKSGLYKDLHYPYDDSYLKAFVAKYNRKGI